MKNRANINVGPNMAVFSCDCQYLLVVKALQQLHRQAAHAFICKAQCGDSNFAGLDAEPLESTNFSKFPGSASTRPGMRSVRRLCTTRLQEMGGYENWNKHFTFLCSLVWPLIETWLSNPHAAWA